MAPPRGFVVAGRFISSWTFLGSLDGYGSIYVDVTRMDFHKFQKNLWIFTTPIWTLWNAEQESVRKLQANCSTTNYTALRSFKIKVVHNFAIGPAPIEADIFAPVPLKKC